MAPKRVSGSMNIKACCRDKNKLLDQYDTLRQKYEQRGQQLQELE